MITSDERETVLEGYVYYGGRSNLSNINAYSAALKHCGSPYPYTPWLYGAIGIPFLFRAAEEVNRDPTLAELPHARIAGLLNNLGVQVEGSSATGEGEKLDLLRKEAWAFVKQAVDAGLPCFGQGFYFNYGETSCVQGYSEAGAEAEAAYIISCWHGTKRIPQPSLGERDGLVDVWRMAPDGREEDDRRTVREALELAVEFAAGRLTGPHMLVAEAAYRRWSTQLRRGTVDGWYFAYNTHEWDTCRTNGYKFLLEAKQRLGEKAPLALDEAIASFAVVQKNIRQVYELFPWEQPKGLIEDRERALAAAQLLEEAIPYDAAALAAFARVAAELRP